MGDAAERGWGELEGVMTKVPKEIRGVPARTWLGHVPLFLGTPTWPQSSPHLSHAAKA